MQKDSQQNQHGDPLQLKLEKENKVWESLPGEKEKLGQWTSLDRAYRN